LVPLTTHFLVLSLLLPVFVDVGLSVDTVVNGHPLHRSRIEAVALGEGISSAQARTRLVEAMLVAEEARRSGFPGALTIADPERLADAYLAEVFSEETLCGNISARQLRQFYEISYKPEWPVDVYQGDVIELRCCPSLADACSAEDVAACKERNQGLPVALERLASEWRGGRLPPLDELTRQYPGLRATDFAFVIWPDIPLDRQRQKSLFDPALLGMIMALEVGEVSGPVESPLGFHVVRLNRFRAAITADSPEFLAAGTHALCRQRVVQTRRDFVARLLGQAVVNPPLKGDSKGNR